MFLIQSYRIFHEGVSISTLIEREVIHHSQCIHPSACKFIGYSPINFNRSKEQPVMFLHYYSKGTLYDIIKRKRKRHGLNNTTKLINIYGIASFMSYLHSQEILHRDLKLSNVLLDKNLHPKVSDFGLSIKISDLTSDCFRCGSAPYIPPEVWKHKDYSKAGDVYAFGILVYEVMSNVILFDGINWQTIEKYVSGKDYRPTINDEMPNCYQTLIQLF